MCKKPSPCKAHLNARHYKHNPVTEFQKKNPAVPSEWLPPEKTNMTNWNIPIFSEGNESSFMVEFPMSAWFSGGIFGLEDRLRHIRTGSNFHDERGGILALLNENM